MFRRVTLVMASPNKSSAVDYASFAKFPSAKNILVAVTPPNTVDFLCDLTQNFGASSTGKTVIISSTAGSRPVGATKASLGFNCYMKPPKGGGAATVDLAAIKEAFDTGLTSRVKGMTVTLENEKWMRCSINLSQTVGPTAAGTSVLIATSSGNIPLGKSGVSFGLNCTHKPNAPVDLSKIKSAISGEVTHHNVVTSTSGKKVRLTIATKGIDLEEASNGKGKQSLAHTSNPTMVGDVIVTAHAFVPVGNAVKAPALAATPIGTNLVVAVDAGGVITIEIDTSAKEKLSSTGMTKMVAATGKGDTIPGTNIAITMSAYRKVPGAIRVVSAKKEEHEDEGEDDEEDEAPKPKKEKKETPKKETPKKPTPSPRAATPVAKSPPAKKVVQLKKEADDAEAPDLTADLPAYMKVRNSVSEILKKTSKSDLGNVSIKELTSKVAAAVEFEGEARDLKPYVKRAVDEFIADATDSK